jgi:beta-lactamase regulating signal transducer with metallopeptidase domain
METFFETVLVERLGWTLFHSLWQIGLVSLVLIGFRALFASSSPNVRYAVSVAALFLALTAPVATFVSLESAASSNDSARSWLDSASPAASEMRSTRGSVDPSTISDETSVTSITPVAQVDRLRAALPLLMPIAVAIWLLGVAIFSLRILGGLWQIRRYKTCFTDAVDDDWQHRLTTLSRKVGLTRTVRMIRSRLINAPIAVGFIRPVIIVPASAFMQISPAQLETILAHELIHIRRLDPLVSFLQGFVETVLFYHPCIWWMSAVARREREFVADAGVLELFGDSHVLYASALAELEEIRQTAGHGLPAAATAANGGNLMQRIERILQKNTEVNMVWPAWSAGAALVLISAVLLTVFSFSTQNFVNAQDTKRANRKLAIGFVSIPPVDRSGEAPRDSMATAKILVEVMKQHRVPAIGFVNGSQISDGSKLFPVRAEIVKMWRDEGFEIGVGGYKHIWFNETPYDDYVENAEKNISIVRPLLEEKGQQVRYFSYPFLNTGKSVGERDQFRSWLNKRGIEPVQYTMDNSEWMYSFAYDAARFDNDVNTMKEVRDSFLAYMSKMTDHYERYSKEMFGRDVAQTLVLTPSRLVADTGHELFGMFEKRGYNFVPMAEAQSDAAYRTPEEFTGNSGISWFERWQMKKGRPLLDEPKVDAEIERVWNKSKRK